MNILIINGSPKRERSNTMNIARAFAEGFEGENSVETAHLYEMNIKPCVGCFSCWSRTEGSCVIRDDMQRIYDMIARADVIIESFPLYFFGMPSQMKAFTDRTLPLMKHYGGNLVSGGGSFHELRDPEMENKRLVVISTCGYVDAEAMYPALLSQYDLICGKGKYTAILCPEGELFIAERAKRQREAYLADIKKAGGEFSRNLCLSEATVKLLKKPILSPKGFEAITKAHWAKDY